MNTAIPSVAEHHAPEAARDVTPVARAAAEAFADGDDGRLATTQIASTMPNAACQTNWGVSTIG